MNTHKEWNSPGVIKVTSLSLWSAGVQGGKTLTMGGRAQEMAMTESGLYKFSVWDQKLNEVGLDQKSKENKIVKPNAHSNLLSSLRYEGGHLSVVSWSQSPRKPTRKNSVETKNYQKKPHPRNQ